MHLVSFKHLQWHLIAVYQEHSGARCSSFSISGSSGYQLANWFTSLLAPLALCMGCRK